MNKLIKKITISLGALTAIAAFSALPAIAASPTWDVRGTYTVDFHCTAGCSGDYLHTMNITNENFTNGNITGNGHYNVNPSYTWTLTGNTTGNGITFHVLYTGTLAGYTLDGTGTIANPGGTFSGTATDSLGEKFTFTTTAGHASLITSNGKAVGNPSFNAYGLNRTAQFTVQNTGNNTTNGSGWYKYTDANGDWYIAQVQYVNVSEDTAWFAGNVYQSSNHTWLSNWVFVKVEAPTYSKGKIWGSFTTQQAAIAGVNGKADPGDGPFTMTSGHMIVTDNNNPGGSSQPF